MGVARAVHRLGDRHRVLIGDDIDRLVGEHSKRGDISVSSPNATVFLECGLQPLMAEAALGDPAAVDEMLKPAATSAG